MARAKKAKATPAQHAPTLLSLPVEVLQNILDILVPRPPERVWDSVEPVPPEVIQRFDGWKTQCQNLRLTCSALAQLPSLQVALFHTFHMFPTGTSCRRLLALASNPHLATMVRAFVAHRPLFGYHDTDWDEYRGLLRSQFQKGKRASLAISGLPPAEVEGCIETLTRSYFPWSDEQVAAGYKYLKRIQRVQRNAVIDRQTQLGLAFAFARFHGLRQLGFCADMDTTHLAQRHEGLDYDLSFPGRQSLLKSRASSLLTEDPQTEGVYSADFVGFYTIVAEALWTSHLRLESLEIWGESTVDDFVGRKHSGLYKELTTLRVETNATPGTMFPVGEDFNSLKKLCLSGTIENFFPTVRRFEESLALAKNISELTLMSVYLEEGLLLSLTQAIQKLTRLTVYNVVQRSKYVSGVSWYTIFNYVRHLERIQGDFSRLHVVEETEQDSEEDGTKLHFLGEDEANENVFSELQRFMTKQGTWTRVLQKHFAYESLDR